MLIVYKFADTPLQRWVPPGLYYVVLKFMLACVRTILPIRFQFEFGEEKNPISSAVCPPYR